MGAAGAWRGTDRGVYCGIYYQGDDMTALTVEQEFEAWLRSACFQKPTPEAYDLAKSAWSAAPPCPDAGLAEEIAQRVWKEQGWASRRNDNHLSSEWNLCLAAVKATLRGGRHD